MESIEGKQKIIENWRKGLVSGKILSQDERKLHRIFINKEVDWLN